MQTKYQIFDLLYQNQKWIEPLQEALNNKKLQHWPGFEWHQVHCPKQTLDKMVTERLLDVTSASRSCTFYMLSQPDTTREALKMIDRAEESPEPEEDQDKQQIPDNMFSRIVFLDNIKTIIQKSIAGSEPVHIMLWGKPATAKSLFLEDLNRLPDSRLVLGSAMSKAGLTEYLITYQPTYLIIDEVEKASNGDLATLLSLMESGVVSRMKYGKTESISLKTWVFASANKPEKLPQELKSRFLQFHIPEYTNDQLYQIAHRILPGQINSGLVDYIVEKMLPRSRDVRDIIKVGKLAGNREEVDMIVETAFSRR